MGTLVSTDGKSVKQSRNRRNDAKPGRVEWKGYLSPTISAAEKKAYREWRSVEGGCEKALKRALDAGYKISVDFQRYEGAYRAGLYCQQVGHPDAGYCLTQFAGDWWEAINRVVFVHSEVLGSDWSKITGKRGWTDDWLD